MKNKSLLLALVVLLFLFACKQPSERCYPVTDNVVNLTEETLPSLEYYDVEKVNLPDDYVNSNYHVYNDTVVIIVNYEHPSPYIVTFLNIETKNVIAGFFKKGIGPDEMITVVSELKCNYLHLTDCSTFSISRLNIDSVLLDGFNYKPVVVRPKCLVCSYDYISDDTITAPNVYFVNGFGATGLDVFWQYNAQTGEPLKSYAQNEVNFPHNVTQRTMAYANSKYIEFWSQFPIINIYDKNFNLIKQYRDSEFDDPEIIKVDADGMIMVNGRIFYSFFYFDCQTDNYIFVSNQKCSQTYTNEDVMKPGFKLGDIANSETWCFNNDFNVVRRFKCNDTKIGGLVSYCEKTGNMYITSVDENDELCLYRCIFKK